VDGVQHVQEPHEFLNWLGFHMPQDMIASWVGPNDEDTTKDWEEIQTNTYTQEDLVNMVIVFSYLRIT